MKHKFKLATAIGFSCFIASFYYEIGKSDLAVTLSLVLIVISVSCWAYFGDRGD